MTASRPMGEGILGDRVVRVCRSGNYTGYRRKAAVLPGGFHVLAAIASPKMQHVIATPSQEPPDHTSAVGNRCKKMEMFKQLPDASAHARTRSDIVPGEERIGNIRRSRDSR